MSIIQPFKRPIVTPEERAYYHPEVLKAIIYSRSVGQKDYPANKDQPQAPEPRFEDPSEGEDLACYIPDNMIDASDLPDKVLALIDELMRPPG